MTYLNLALKTATESTHPRHRMGAVIVRGGAVLARAANTGRWHRCAERRAARRRSFPGATAYVMRSNRGCSKPCVGCQAALREAGISKVVYVGVGGVVETMVL